MILKERKIYKNIIFSFMTETTETIQFVNQKSVERVGVLVQQLRDCFSSAAPPHTECQADSVLERIDKDPLFPLKESKSIKYPMSGEAQPNFDNPLKQFEQNSYYLPATLPKDISQHPNDLLNRQKREFLINARQEHHRMLWAFQDRLIYDAAIKQNSGYKSPFQTMAKYLTKESDIPILHESKVSPEAAAAHQQTQGKYAALLRKTQAATGELLETQTIASGMLFDREKYRAEHGINNTEEQNHVHDIPLFFPFHFLVGNESTK